MEQTLKMYEAVFAPFGGRLIRDKADKWWELETTDFVLGIELYGSRAQPGYRLEVACAVCHKELSGIAAKVMGCAANMPNSFKYEQTEREVETLDGAELVYQKIIEEKLKEIQSIDMRGVIKELAANCPDQPYMRQIMHLASLAYLGDFTTLMDYQKIFERGYRLNFIPAIDKSMIDRATEIAIERA